MTRLTIHPAPHVAEGAATGGFDYGVALSWSAAEGISSTKVLVIWLRIGCACGQGFLSSVGYLLWMAAAAIALFAAFTGQIKGPVVNRQVAFCGGGFSLWLCLDDMFLVHDRYLGESFLYVTYAVFSVLWVRFRGALRRFGGDSFVLAVILLGSSVLIDAFQGVFPASYETVQLFEEGEISGHCSLARFLVPLRERLLKAQPLLNVAAVQQ